MGQVTRREFLKNATAVLGGVFVGTAALSRQARGAMRHRFIMNEAMFLRSVGHPDHKDLRRKMLGAVCYVNGEREPNFGTIRVPNRYTRDAERIFELIDAGDLSSGESITWAIENGGGGPWPVDPVQQTPPEQQLNLEDWLRRVRNRTHEAGVIFIAAPAGDIMYTIAPDYEGTPHRFLLDYRIPALCSRYADVFGVQAQQDLQNVDSFEAKVRACTRQARSADPTTRVLAGVTTNSRRSEPEDYPTYREIFRAMDRVREAVDGYWLNVPPHRETGIRDYMTMRRALRLFCGLPAMV